MFKDYYAVLVISQSATLAEIKSAYRTQAMRWHPDINRGMDTTEKMKEINEAKLILTDEEARVRYDREYLRFKSFQQENQKAKKTEEPKQKQYEHKKQEQEMITEFRDSSIAGFGTFFKTALMTIVIGIIYFIIIQLLKSI
jgi:DnaJ-class molecular chaperone